MNSPHKETGCIETAAVREGLRETLYDSVMLL